MKAKEQDHFKEGHFKKWINYEDALKILSDKLGIDINGIDEVNFEFRKNIDGKYLVISVKRANEKNLAWWQIESNTSVVGCQHIYSDAARKERKRKILSEVE